MGGNKKEYETGVLNQSGTTAKPCTKGLYNTSIKRDSGGRGLREDSSEDVYSREPVASCVSATVAIIQGCAGVWFRFRDSHQTRRNPKSAQLGIREHDSQEADHVGA